MVPPRAHITGINEKPRAILDSSVSSANMLFMTPMFPFSMPFKQRLGDRVRWDRPQILGQNTPEDKRRERTGKAEEDD
jgi:hypothetical protein